MNERAPFEVTYTSDGSEDEEVTIRSIFAGTQAIVLEDHFVYRSGNHGSVYINKDAVYVYPKHVFTLCDILALRFADSYIDVVVGPEIGGVILSQWAAYCLEVPSVFAEKTGGGFVLKRGYDKIVRGKRVLVVEDVLTTGGSVLAVCEAVARAGGLIVGVGALANRGGVTAEQLGVETLHALLDVEFEQWPAADCPLCKRGMAINTELGHGRSYVSEHGQPVLRLIVT